MSEALAKLIWARQNLQPVEPRYRIVFEDPAAPDAPVKVTMPAPNWLAAAMHGGIIRRLDGTGYEPAMTEEEAMEFLLEKSVPAHVLNDHGNRARYVICLAEQVPSDRTYRNAWRLAA